MLTDDDNVENIHLMDNNGPDLLKELKEFKICDDGSSSSELLLKTNPVFDLNRQSSKIRLIIKYVEKTIRTTEDKIIIVSQWASSLKVLKTRLDLNGMRVKCFNSSECVSQRYEIVENFNNPKHKTRILLMPIVAGSLGLNLI